MRRLLACLRLSRLAFSRAHALRLCGILRARMGYSIISILAQIFALGN
jgi:hypothetical protein